MKKIAVFLCFALLICSMGTIASAQAQIPVSAEFSENAEGDLHIVVYLQGVENLISLRTVIEYDTSAYNLKSAKASTYTDSYGDETEKLQGMWVFGNLADGSGCVGAFISMNGVSKPARTAVCEFVLESVNGEFNTDEISLSVTELLTDDGDEENDICKKTGIPFGEAAVDASGFFGYEIHGEVIGITEFKTDNNVVFVPQYIDGLTVRSLENGDVCKNPFIVFERNVLKVCDGVFSSSNTVIAPALSAPVASVNKAGGKYLGYYENVTPDLNENVLYTDTYLVSENNRIFYTNADFTVEPSHNILKNYWGTGTVITLKNGENSADFILCVKGDVNGDSVCDALDTVLTERFVNGLSDPESTEKKSADFDNNKSVDVQDYSRIVNIALGSEYKIFEGIRGDLNGDYAVDILDVLCFNKRITDASVSAEEKAELDFNNNGALDSDDKIILNELVMIFA